MFRKLKTSRAWNLETRQSSFVRKFVNRTPMGGHQAFVRVGDKFRKYKDFFRENEIIRKPCQQLLRSPFYKKIQTKQNFTRFVSSHFWSRKSHESAKYNTFSYFVLLNFAVLQCSLLSNNITIFQILLVVITVLRENQSHHSFQKWFMPVRFFMSNTFISNTRLKLAYSR